MVLQTQVVEVLRASSSDALRMTGSGPPLSVERVDRLADDFDGFLDVVMCFVDVLQGVLLQSLGEAVVFFLGDVVVGSVHQLERAVKAAGPIHADVDWWMIVDVFSIIDGGSFDFGNGIIDFVDCLFLLLAQLAAVGALQVGAGMAQVG